MKATWHKAQWALRDAGDDRAGTVSIYCDYDLRSWTFGLRFEPDPCWFDFHLDLGPISLSVIYWRYHVAVLDFDMEDSE